MSLDIVFVYPSMKGGKKPKFALPPLGILYLASICKKKGFSVKLIDAEGEGLNLNQVVGRLVAEKPKLVAISIMTSQVIQALRISRTIKKIMPHTKIILGGAHINSVEEEVFKFSKNVDFLVAGEGEYTVLELMKNIEKGDYSRIDGLIWKKNGKVIVNKPRKLIEDLDRLPFPDLDLLKLNIYRSPYSQHNRIMSIMCSRGCPFRCTFCDAYKTHGRVARRRSPKNIVGEIERDYKEYRIKSFAIKHSTFVIDKKWVSDICDEILKRKLKIEWSCNTRVGTLDYWILNKMKKSGCCNIAIGVESGSQKVLDKIKKGIRIEQIIGTFKLVEKVGIRSVAYFMIGNPGDNVREVRKTINLAKKINPDLVQFSISTPFPNTELYDWALEAGVLKNKYWYMEEVENDKGYFMSWLGHLELPGFSPKMQEKLQKRAIKEFYFRPKYIWKSLKRFNTIAGIKININGFIELLKGL